MAYIRHGGDFYKKVDIKKLSKEELIDLIKNAIEIKPSIIEKWINSPIYIEKYPNRNQRWCGTGINYLHGENNISVSTKTGLTSGLDSITSGTTTFISESSNTACIDKSLLTMKKDDLITLCNNI